MPDPALLKFVADLGAWGLALLALAIVWLHNRDDKVVHERVREMEKRIDLFEGMWAEQRAELQTANRLSAQADNTIITEIARLGQRTEAISTRVDSIDRATVELKRDVLHYAQQTGRRERSPG